MARADPKWDPTLGDPVQPASRILTLNVSRIRDFQRCRRMFFLRWVLRLVGEDPDDSEDAWIGSTTHQALHGLHVKGLERQQHNPGNEADELVSIDVRVGQMIRTHTALCPGAAGSSVEYLDGEVDARWLIARKSVLLTGRFDALWRHADGTIEVRDYKTGRCPDSLQGDLGAAIYLLLAANLDCSRTPSGELRPIRVVYEALAGPEGRLVSVEASRSRLRDAYNEIVALADHIRTEKTFPANPSGVTCRTCSYRHCCPQSEAQTD